MLLPLRTPRKGQRQKSGRDPLDFDAATTRAPELLADETTRRDACKRRRALLHRLSLPMLRLDCRHARHHSEAGERKPFDRAKAEFMAWLEGVPERQSPFRH